MGQFKKLSSYLLLNVAFVFNSQRNRLISRWLLLKNKKNELFKKAIWH